MRSLIAAQIRLSAFNDEGAEYRISLLNPFDNPQPAWSYKTEFLIDGKTELVFAGVRSQKNWNQPQGWQQYNCWTWIERTLPHSSYDVYRPVHEAGQKHPHRL